MTDARPIGFREYVRSNGFHTVYLLTTVHRAPVKIGISEDPVMRIGNIQAGHYAQLVFQRFWWLPGMAVASRIESAFKRDHAVRNIRGEWFDMSPSDAEREVAMAIRQLGIWSLTQSEMEHLFDDWVRKKWGIPECAPSPLPGRPPRKDEPWQRRQERRRQPYVPTCPWDRATP
jgi:hypothetical protein